MGSLIALAHFPRSPSAGLLNNVLEARGSPQCSRPRPSDSGFLSTKLSGKQLQHFCSAGLQNNATDFIRYSKQDQKSTSFYVCYRILLA